MKKIVFVIAIIVCVLGCSAQFYKASKDTYMKERLYVCKVLSKLDNQYDTSVKGVVHHNRDFTLVMSTEGKTFSLDVTPATWATCKEGDILRFDLAPYQLDFYNGTPVRGYIVAWIVSIISLGFIWILAVWLFGED